jgi:hypothetical protein
MSRWACGPRFSEGPFGERGKSMRRVTMIAVLILYTTTTFALASEPMTMEQDILVSVGQIAAKWGVTKEDVAKKGMALILNGKIYSDKGGMGLIRDKIYVVTDSPNNEVVAGKDKTVGSASDTSEIFAFSRGKVIGIIELPNGGADDVALALFTPEKIRIFDWKELSGGYYSRNTSDIAEPRGAAGKQQTP